jgi:radical SAM protein with 4Fe4S-binding SPASM domain
MIRIPIESPITTYLYNKATQNGIPLSGTFELTPLCNMNCKMCYVRLEKSEQEVIGPLHTAEEWISLAKEARNAGMLYLLLTGGEPFLHPQFRQILTELHHMGFLISINSNGTMIDEKTVEWLKEVPPIRMNITLYGASDETYEKLCANAKGFTQATRAIELLCEAGIQVKINCSVTPHNAKDLPKIIEYAKKRQLLIQPTSYMFPPIRKNEMMVGKNDRFTPEEASYYFAYTDYLIYGKEKFLERCESKMPMLMDTEEVCGMEGEKISCRAGKSSFWISWNGEILPCGMFAAGEKLNVFKMGFHKAWEEVKKQTEMIRLPKKCAVCSLKDRCRSCAAMVYAETGSFDKVPEYRCEMVKAFDAQRMRMKEMIQEGEF